MVWLRPVGGVVPSLLVDAAALLVRCWTSSAGTRLP
jgi:hypothetical protein